MFEKSRKTAIAASMCTLFVGPASVSAEAVSTDQSPFVSKDLGTGYMVAAEGKCGEGKCGGKKEEKAEGKCGGKTEAEGKCGEGKCGGKKADKAEGKCGEGKCGGEK
mgnify:CR=1 FL=1